MTGWTRQLPALRHSDPIIRGSFQNASWEMLRAFQPESRFNDLDDWNSRRWRRTLVVSANGSAHAMAMRRRWTAPFWRRGHDAARFVSASGEPTDARSRRE